MGRELPGGVPAPALPGLAELAAARHNRPHRSEGLAANECLYNGANKNAEKYSGYFICRGPRCRRLATCVRRIQKGAWKLVNVMLWLLPASAVQPAWAKVGLSDAELLEVRPAQ